MACVNSIMIEKGGVERETATHKPQFFPRWYSKQDICKARVRNCTYGRWYWMKRNSSLKMFQAGHTVLITINMKEDPNNHHLFREKNSSCKTPLTRPSCTDSFSKRWLSFILRSEFLHRHFSNFYTDIFTKQLFCK